MNNALSPLSQTNEILKRFWCDEINSIDELTNIGLSMMRSDVYMYNCIAKMQWDPEKQSILLAIAFCLKQVSEKEYIKTYAFILQFILDSKKNNDIFLNLLKRRFNNYQSEIMISLFY
jgi:hypothetical protein